MKEMKCSICGKIAENLIEFDGKWLCSDCVSNETVSCEHCGSIIWADDNAGDDSHILCQRCFDDHYTCCTHCDRVIHRSDAYYDDDEPYCHNCYTNHCDTRPIHDYYYKPDPIFYGKGNRFFGVELEVDDAGECDSSAEAILDIAGEDHIYCKHDGSLDDGFEVVTHPMTIDYHMNEMPWANVLAKLRKMGYLSHQAGTCGLHVHVNRDSLGENIVEQEACIARILFFFEKNFEELIKFSRRTSRSLERWAARYGLRSTPHEILDHAKKGTCNGRYTCINLENANTIEFRMFRGTLKYNTFISTIMLVNKVCDLAYNLSDDEMRAMSWTSFVSSCTEPELIQYLKERRIYINEPVTYEEEM